MLLSLSYTLDQLKAGEALAFEREKDRLAGAQKRVRVFRNELVQLLIANLATIPDTVRASISKFSYSSEGASGLIHMSIHIYLYIFM